MRSFVTNSLLLLDYLKIVVSRSFIRLMTLREQLLTQIKWNLHINQNSSKKNCDFTIPILKISNIMKAFPDKALKAFKELLLFLTCQYIRCRCSDESTPNDGSFTSGSDRGWIVSSPPRCWKASCRTQLRSAIAGISMLSSPVLLARQYSSLMP